MNSPETTPAVTPEVTTAMEIVTFKLKSDTDPQQWLDAQAAVNEFVKAQPGFYYRSLSCDDTDTWFDILYWQDMAKAKAAGDAFMESAAGQAICPLIEMESCTLRHMTAITEAMICEGNAEAEAPAA